jgi:exopolysaccharide biosynthesis protein
MKKVNKSILVLVFLLFCSVALSFMSIIYYDPNYVKISSANFNGEKFTLVNMTRSGERIKAKYFAAKDQNGSSVFKRYTEWSKNKNIVLVCGAAYFNNQNQPVGLTIDDGKLVNKEVSDRGNALVVVYATGGIAVSNIKEGNLGVKCNNVDKKFNLKDEWDKGEFIKCAKDQSATVFQQHLLVYRNQLNDFKGISSDKRERRFLAVGKDVDGKLVHTIVDYPNAGATLKEGGNKAFNFLKDYCDMQEITFMINLDTGMQNVFKLYDKNGNVRNDITGSVDPKDAVNLLVYYFE